jgi:hypothetical protein
MQQCRCHDVLLLKVHCQWLIHTQAATNSSCTQQARLQQKSGGAQQLACCVPWLTPATLKL